jgi:hypothetical protein
MRTSLLSTSQDCGHYAWVAPSVHHGNNPKRLFVGSVSDQILTYRNEAQGPSSKVWALAAHARERDERIYSLNYFRYQAVGGFAIIRADEVPDLVKVATDFRVEVVGDYSPDCFRWAAALSSRK